jgi:hypothetical protein
MHTLTLFAIANAVAFIGTCLFSAFKDFLDNGAPRRDQWRS